MTPLSDNARGAFYMVLGNAGYAFNDCFIKLIAADLPLEQIVWLRGLMVTTLFFLMAWGEAAFHFNYSRRDIVLVMLRALAEIATTIFFLSALVRTPIFLLTAIIQSAPLMVTVVGAVFLREAVGFRRWSATLIGFCGVLLIVQPGPEGLNESATLGLLATVSIVVRDILTRMMSQDVHPSFTGALSSLCLTVFAGLACLLIPSALENWVPLAEITHWTFLLAATGCLFCAYFFSIATMRYGDISFVSPFRYTGMIWVALTGYYVFNDPFDLLAVFGVALVVASSMYTLLREAQLRH